MAMYSYGDASRKNKVYARNAQQKDKGTRYYCPNPECDAHMYLANLEGLSASYFRATKSSHKHVAGCPYHALNGFDSNKHDENTFEFENALTAMMAEHRRQKKKEKPGNHKEGKSTSKPLRTIREIYSMCKNYDSNEKYNGVPIGEMLVDNRSISAYSKGVSGWKIIEGKCKKPYFYDADKMEIYIMISNKKETYTFILMFKDKELFKEMRNSIFSNKKYTMVVAGLWTLTGEPKTFSTTLSSKKQFLMVT